MEGDKKVRFAKTTGGCDLMLDQATIRRVFALFKDTIRAALKEEFSTERHADPLLDKIVLNMGIGEAVKDTKKVGKALKSCR